MPPKVAAITMAYNEGVWLPIWARHYARQVGADHCYVVDHGSTEPVVVPPGVNVVRLPRSPHDDARRAKFVSDFAAGLLQYYDWVIHTDVDEIVVADPRLFANLPDFCSHADRETVTAVGFDIQHVPDLEPPLDSGRPLGIQRGWARFTSAMCKPVLTRRPVMWSPGFHCYDGPLMFGLLFLFHLRWADHAVGLERLAKTRTMPWADGPAGAHQRVTDRTWFAMFEAMAALPRSDITAFDLDGGPVQRWTQAVIDSGAGREAECYTLDLHISPDELWSIPSYFRDRL